MIPLLFNKFKIYFQNKLIENEKKSVLEIFVYSSKI